MGRGLIIALFFSLGVNVFLGGFVAGRLLHSKPPAPPPGMQIDSPVRMFGEVGALTPETRKVFREVYRGQRGEFRRNRAEAHRLREAFSAALAAKEFDRAAAEAALDQLRRFENERSEAASMLLIDVFERLPAEERAALIARAEERRKMRWERRGRRRDMREQDRFGPGPEEEE